MKIDWKRAMKAMVLCSISVAAFPVIYYLLGRKGVKGVKDETDTSEKEEAERRNI